MEGQKRWVEEDAIVIDEEDGQDAPDTHRLHPRSSSMTLAPPLPDPTFNPPADSHALPNTLHRYHSESSTGDPESGSTSQQRSPSLSSPPPPPSFFNPPADIPPVPLDLLSPPVSAGSSTNSSFALLPSTRLSPGPSLEGFLAHRRPSVSDALLSPPHRPDIRALQKVSSDSVNRVPASHGSSFSSNGGHDNSSDAGEHLAEARERLIQEAAVDVAEELKATSPFSNPNQNDLNVTTPAPPLKASHVVGEEQAPVVPPIRRGSTFDEIAQEDPQRAWDSVWPAPGTAVRPPAPPIDSVMANFPIAPISPFVTPAFSPALAGMPNVMAAIATALPTSPRVRPTSPTLNRSPSPSRVQTTKRASPTSDVPALAHLAESSSSGRRGSFVHSMSPLSRSPTITSPVPISRHTRSKSGTSPNSATPLHFPRESLERIIGTPPTSPHGSPTRRHMSLSSGSRGSFSESGRRSGSPVRHSSLSISSTRTASRRLSEIQPSPPLVPPSPTRRRGSSVSTDLSPVPEPPENGNPSPRSDSAVIEDKVDRPYWHRTGSNNSTGSRSDPFPASDYASPGVLPPINLPPPLALSPIIASGTLEKLPSQSPSQPSSNSRLSRPTALRRAISDYETKSRQNRQVHQAIPLNRSLSDLADVARVTKRSPDLADIASPTLPGSAEDPETSRVRKSPRRSPRSLPGSALAMSQSEGTTSAAPGPARGSETLAIVDEGDVLPSTVIDETEYDITFDDEGLSTLERIFLLSKSDFPFHRAYVARVLGDLLYEVDPCESVEYVLPLVNGFTMDEEEAVKEALVSQLHRILWYFFSYCRMYVEGEEDPETLVMTQPELRRETFPTGQASTSFRDDGTAAWVQTLDQTSPPGPDDVPHRPSLADTLVGSSRGSDFRREIAPGHSTSDETETPGSGGTLFSPSDQPSSKNGKEDGEIIAADSGPIHNLPPLPTNFFTPLLGALLLNSNPAISEMCRASVVKLIGRIRGKAELDPVVWGIQTEHQARERQTYLSQTGPHSHWTTPLDARSATIIEAELMRGIVVGMGSLETEMPYDLMPSASEGLSDEDREAAAREAEIFKEQLLAEALAGRATSLNLIGSLCEYYSGDEAVERGFAAEIARCADGDETVKAEGAVALKSYAEIAPVKHVQSLLPVFEALMTDDDNHVRQNAACSLPALCRRIESDPFRRSFAIKAIETLSRGDPEVRMAALETLGEVIYAFKSDPRGPPDELLQVFRDDGNASQFNQEDCDYLTCFNLPGVCLTLGPKRWVELRDLYSRLLERATERILVSIAAALHELAKILDTPDVVRDLLPAFKRCMTGSEEVRERLFEHVDVFLGRLDQSTGREMLRTFATWWTSGEIGRWRAREQFASHIPDLLNIFPGDESAATVLRLTDMALHDPFASVREAAAKGVSDGYSTLGEGVAKAYRDLLINLGDSSSFKHRIMFIRCIREFAMIPPNRAAFEEHFVPLLPRFITDMVDVRLALAQASAALFNPDCYERYPDAPPLIAQIVFDLSADESVDVRDVIAKLDVVRLSELHPSPLAHSRAALRLATPAAAIDQDGEVDYFSLGFSPKSVPAVPAQPVRRPSAEVAAKMDGMQLQPHSDHSEELIDPFADPQNST